MRSNCPNSSLRKKIVIYKQDRTRYIYLYEIDNDMLLLYILWSFEEYPQTKIEFNYLRLI